MSSKKALILGVSGQDGSYLASFLSKSGYDVVGICRSTDLWRHQELGINNKIKVIRGDLRDQEAFSAAIREEQPTEIYNFSAQSSVSASFLASPDAVFEDASTVYGMLQVIRNVSPDVRFYQASSSEMFGAAQEEPQIETTPLRPMSPYAIAKASAHYLIKMYRESFGLHATSGILYNHESPLRSKDFVTRKITWGLAKARYFDTPPLELGNLDAKRDWGFAPDYVRGMWLMVQQDAPDDFILASGTAHSVRDFVTFCATALNFEIVWDGSGIDEVGRCRKTGRTLVRVNRAFFRPTDPTHLVGSAKKARNQLSWEPTVTFGELVSIMAHADRDRILNGSA